MKTIYKYLYLFVFSLILGAVLLYGTTKTETHIFSHPVSFYVTVENQSDRVLPYSADGNTYYIFLPSYARMEDIHIQSESTSTILIGDIPLSDGMDCTCFEIGQEYAFSMDLEQRGTLCFMKSANVATLFLNTASGSMEAIHKNKETSEYASVSLYSSNGTLTYQNTQCKLNGRGNATWVLEKKPYVLTLPEDTSLLNMEPDTKWILLANATDTTNLHNKLVFDMAREINSTWAPECEYVDIYLNGDYSGLYLLTEKIDAAHLDLDVSSGDFLCGAEMAHRWNGLQNPVISAHGRTIEISEPKRLSRSEKVYIEECISKMEQVIFSGENIYEEHCFDTDSWICRYLIDEISGNIDADLASSCFYQKDGIFYAGPVWDYDMTFGTSYRNYSPRAFVAKNYYKSLDKTSPYHDALYHNPSFYSRMTEIYRSAFLPLLNDLISNGVTAMSDTIASAAQMNAVRWSSMFDGLQQYMRILPQNTQQLLFYLKERVDFLNLAWIEGENIYPIQVEQAPDDMLLNLSTNSSMADFSELLKTEWFHYQTGETVLPEKILSEDVILVTSEHFASQSSRPDIDTQDIITVVSVLFLLFLLAIFMTVDKKTHRKGRRKTDVPGRTQIPT